MLAAVIAEARHDLSSLIRNDSVKITYVHKFDDAVNLLLSVNYDLIICGVHFDDSRSLELLQRVKQIDKNRDIPFVMLRMSSNPIGEAMSGSIQLAVRELGGTDYFDLSESVVNIDQMKIHFSQVLQSLIEAQPKSLSSR
ncbi:MAG: hypothetical protein C5B53_10135 [Candidatus Melainabacteria bacterium]|nr:MAG: hypothetical protein C5B53_10135 [Candidatus Melainabacteria bacterium]